MSPTHASDDVVTAMRAADVAAMLDRAARGAPWPEALRDGRFVVLHGLSLSAMRDPIGRRDRRFKRLAPWIGDGAQGTFDGFEAALEALWRSSVGLHEALDGEAPDEARAPDWRDGLARWLSRGTWTSPEGPHAAYTDPGVRAAKRRHPRSSVVFAYSAGAPVEGERACVLELPLATLRTDGERALVAACRARDLDAARALVASGVSPRFVDDEGDTPLHHAVAHRDGALVAVLLDAGADAGALERFGHGALWAAYDAQGGLGALTTRIEGPAHGAIVDALLARGADADARDTTGRSLLDLVADALPFDASQARSLASRGAGSCLTEPAAWRALVTQLSALHRVGAPERARLPGRLRALAMVRHDLRDALAGWLSVGYREREVPAGEVLDIARAFVDANASAAPRVPGGRRASEQAAVWVTSAGCEHYAEIARMLEALEARQGLRA